MMRSWKNLIVRFLIFFTAGFSASVFAQGAIAIKMYRVSRSGKDGRYMGVVIAKNTRRGLLLVPRLHGLSPGFHGFHLHQYPSCKNFAKAAGAHWDPKKTGRHRGPYRPDGHRGDLPALYVGSGGVAKRAVLAPHLRKKQLKGHALVIHQGGDNYTDHPPNGGGGKRIVCGVVW